MVSQSQKMYKMLSLWYLLLNFPPEKFYQFMFLQAMYKNVHFPVSHQ